jgi:hypothetical protein
MEGSLGIEKEKQHRCAELKRLYVFLLTEESRALVRVVEEHLQNTHQHLQNPGP